MLRFGKLSVIFAVLLVSSAPSQTVDAKSQDYLSGVTHRGQELYAYDQAAWHGTDAFFELHPDRDGLAHYICTKTTVGWKVVFPKWNATHDRLLISYEAAETSQPNVYRAQAIDPPREANDDLLAEERAIELVLNDFKTPARPYNTAILRATGGDLYVYLYPAQTKNTVWPLGGDVRYTLSADGKRILEKRQLHKVILDMEYEPAKNPVAGIHGHVLSDVPEDTDVLYVLNRRPLIPEYIVIAPEKLWVINTGGSIALTKPCNKSSPMPCDKK